MRIILLICVVVASSLSSPAFCDDGADDFPPPILHDPSLATSVYIPPAVTTADVAAVGSPRGAVTRPLPCSRTNPCAMATPAADYVRPARTD